VSNGKKEYVLNEYFHKPQQGDTTTLRISYRDGDEGVFVSIYKGKNGAAIKLNPMEVHDLIHTLEGVARTLRRVRTQRLTQKREDYLKQKEEEQKKASVSVETYDLAGPEEVPA